MGAWGNSTNRCCRRNYGRRTATPAQVEKHAVLHLSHRALDHRTFPVHTSYLLMPHQIISCDALRRKWPLPYTMYKLGICMSYARIANGRVSAGERYDCASCLLQPACVWVACRDSLVACHMVCGLSCKLPTTTNLCELFAHLHCYACSSVGYCRVPQSSRQSQVKQLFCSSKFKHSIFGSRES